MGALILYKPSASEPSEDRANINLVFKRPQAAFDLWKGVPGKIKDQKWELQKAHILFQSSGQKHE